MAAQGLQQVQLARDVQLVDSPWLVPAGADVAPSGEMEGQVRLDGLDDPVDP